jgi:hypothetical protein
MEPQINYSYMPQQQPVYSRKKSGCGKFAIIGTIILLLIIGGAAYLIYYGVNKVKEVVKIPGMDFGVPKENPENIDKRFTGSFMDAVLIPQSDGSSKLFILADGSVKFMLKQKSTGHWSMGLSCNDCKTISYILDPASGKVEKQTVNTFSEIIHQSHIVLSGGKVIQFTNPGKNDGVRINTYDPATGEIISDTKAFIDQHKELSSGIIDLTFHDKDQTVSFKTKDGQRDPLYDPETNKFYKDEIKMRDELGEAAGSGKGILYVLRTETRDKRESLFKVTASKKDIITRESTLASYVDNLQFLKDIIPTAVIEKATDKTFLNGQIAYQDDDCVVIMYVDQAGKTANRLLTCFDSKTGKELWDKGPDDLFPEMKIDEKNNSGSSEYDFRLRIRRTENIIMLTYEGTGIKGFDLKTGKQLWEVEIHDK